MIFIVALLIVLSLSGSLVYAQEEQTKQVLVLNSYHKGFLWTDNIVIGIESVLGSEENDIELRIEYMDSKSTTYTTWYKEKLYDLYKYKYGNQTFDLIISTDDNAFNFLGEYHKDIFPDTPIVFCGVNNLEAPNIIDRDIFTGMIEHHSIKETIDIALSLHPETTEIVFVVDNTPSGSYMWNQIQELFEYYESVQMTRIDESFSMEEIEDKVSRLPYYAIVYWGTFHRDKFGTFYSFEEGGLSVPKVSSRPLYGHSAQLLPYGIVGGKLLGGFYQGEVAAKMALHILNGEKVRDIPVLTEPQTQYMFDYEQMQRWDIKVSDLPEDSIIINKPYSFYEENKGLIWSIIIVIIFQVLIIITLLMNISRRKRAEEELHERAAALERSNAELEQFAYVASHDLQEPLRMISSYVQLLKRRYKDRLDADADDFIGYAVDGANRMQTLINDLLIFSRVGTRGKPFETTNCEDVLEQALTHLEVAIEDSGAVVTHDSLPNVMGDSTQLTQLLRNLIGNAIKFCSEELPCIHVSAKRSESGYIFSVADNGIGIETEYYDRIFVIFQRLHGREKYTGTGIGLAVCKKIVERHGGRIWVESEPGKGTVFYFTMPVSVGDE